MESNTHTTTSQREWLTPLELQEEYGFSKSTQAKMRMKKTIPFSKVGNYIRYSRKAIDKMLEDASVSE